MNMPTKTRAGTGHRPKVGRVHPCVAFGTSVGRDCEKQAPRTSRNTFNSGASWILLIRDAFPKTATAQSGRAFTEPDSQSPVLRDDYDYESEAPASLPSAGSKTLSHLWKSQLFRSGHPSPVCDGSSGRQTHAGDKATFEVAQEDGD